MTFRLRIRFQKAGRLRHLSHLETTRALERTARRAGLPYAVTQGYSPRMRVAFGPALPVGTAGLREYLDITLTSYVPASEALARLQAASVEELAPSRTGYAGESEPSLSAALTIAEYEAVVAAREPREVSDGLEAVIGAGELVTERKGRTKVYDLAEMLPKKPMVSSRGTETIVQMTTRMGPTGSLRPEQLIRSALQPSGADKARILVTRTDLLFEEGSDWLRPLD